MSRKGLDYSVTPDLVQRGAPAHPSGAPTPPAQTPAREPAAASTSSEPARSAKPPDAPAKPRGRLDYEPTAFPGALAPAGPSPKAIAALKEQGMWTETPAPARETTVASTRPPAPVASRPTGETRRAAGPVAAAPAAAALPHAPPAQPVKQESPSTRPAPKPRPKASPELDGEARVARTIRLAPNVDAQIQAIAARFGVDLTAAVAIAVTHGYAALAANGLVSPVRPGEP